MVKNAKDKKKKNTPRRKRKSARKSRHPLLKFMFFGGLFCLLGLVAYVGWCALSMPDINQAINRTRSPSVTLIASNGNEINSFGTVYSTIIRASDLPKHVTDAIVYTEDHRFYTHCGFDIISFTRAALTNIFAGRYAQGGSTITQQVAKNLFLTNQKNLRRKVQELLLAFWLEHKFTKEQILSLYLNRVYFGNGAYGIEAAANKYFQKTSADLNLLEGAVLAGMLKAPSRYNPISSKTQALQRAKVVLGILRSNHLLSDKTYQQALQLPLGPRKPAKVKSGAYFADSAYNETLQLLGEPDNDIYVLTTLDQKLQEKASEVLQKNLAAHPKAKATQGAVIIMDTKGAIKAMVGGTSYAKSQFNRATQALRQPGSSFKMFVYLTAAMQGMTAKDTITDSPININGWRPENHDKKFYGEVTLRYAFAQSLNLAAVNLAQKVGVGNIIKTARKLGITTRLNNDLSLALGTSVVKVIDMAAAYAVIANGGYAVWPHMVEEIYTLDGYQLYQRAAPQDLRIIDEASVTTMKKLMREVFKTGTGRFARLNRETFGKTGTSQDHRDAWFIGFDNELITAVWLGNDDNSPMNNVYGSGLPAQIWQQIMR
ncbi:MAG: penicillin-binding protein [Alphaproteobacteria bacterium]|nr:penicillin-binding protein [Alphaproteobacteria bacterium]MBQ9236173.1 penicillin-binding protein [Alphaproteobacteria bacterium]